MNPNQSRTLWLSVGSAFFAMMLIYSYSQEKKAEYDKKFGTMKRVVVASKDILEMQTIDDTMVSVEELPAEYVQPGAIENPEEFTEQYAAAYVAAAPIKKGEQILVTKLLAPGPNTGLALQVAPGKRAVTLPVDDVRGLSKLIRPGDRIDVVTSIESGSGANRRTDVKTLMQDVTVLSTGVQITNNIPRSLEPDGKSFRNLRGDMTFSTVTVEANPQEAQDLIAILAGSPGSIYLTLRHPSDRIKRNDLRTSNTDNVLNNGVDRNLSSVPSAR